MNSCEFLTIKEEIKSLKKEIKKTTKKLKKLEYKARECYYSNLSKDVDNEIIDENGVLNNPAVTEFLIKYFKDTNKDTDGNSIDDETAKVVLNNFKGQYEEELDNE